LRHIAVLSIFLKRKVLSIRVFVTQSDIYHQKGRDNWLYLR
jgi:hypothetical protein